MADLLMPQLAHSHHGFHHTLASALETLNRTSVPASRIRVRLAGLAWPNGWVARQTPAAGEPIGPAGVILDVGGLGCYHRLPLGMRWLDAESQAGTRGYLAPFDDLLASARHWRDEGPLLFNISPGDTLACRRWLELLGLHAEDWPPENWFALALLAASLHRMAGTESGLRLGLRLLLGVELESVVYQPASLELPAAEVTCLGKRYSRLGVDAIVGAKYPFPKLCRLCLRLRDLQEYAHFQAEEARSRRDSVMQLLLPFHLQYEFRFRLGDPAAMPQLGAPERNSALGINSYMGREAWKGAAA